MTVKENKCLLKYAAPKIRDADNAHTFGLESPLGRELVPTKLFEERPPAARTTPSTRVNKKPNSQFVGHLPSINKRKNKQKKIQKNIKISKRKCII